MDEFTEIKSLIDTKDVVLGSEQSIKNLKKGNVEKVFITSNCSTRTKQEIEEYAKIDSVDVSVMDMTNEDLGMLCKKPFSISVLSVIKGK